MTSVHQDSQKPRRLRPLQLASRVSFVLLLLALIWTGYTSINVHRERLASAELAKMGIDVLYDHQQLSFSEPTGSSEGSSTDPIARRWWRRLCGEDYFQEVTGVTLWATELSEIKVALPHLKALPHLTDIFISVSFCGNDTSFPKAKELLERELPSVKVTGFAFPIVG